MHPREQSDPSPPSTELLRPRVPANEHTADEWPALATPDLEKLTQIVNEIMEWPNKAAEVVGTDALFAGRFKLVQRLGRGSFGVVYQAIDSKRPTDGQDVALKLLHFPVDEETQGNRPISPSKKKALDNLIKELKRHSAATKIPGCVPLLDSESPPATDFDDTLAFVRESPIWFSMPVYRCSLADHLRANGGKLPTDKTVDVMVEVAKTLQRLHNAGDAGIFHRDLKPGNILLSDDDTPLVADYGLSVACFDQRLMGNATGGTWVYMSPEQIDGLALTAQCDIWSWGVIFYQLVSGKLPFGGQREDMLNHIRASKFPPSWGLLVPTNDDSLAQMHPLVQQTVVPSRGNRRERIRSQLIEFALAQCRTVEQHWLDPEMRAEVVPLTAWAMHLLREDPERGVTLQATLGNLLRKYSQFRDAEPLLRHALRVTERLFGIHSVQVATCLSDLGVLLLDLAQFDEAEPLMRRALAIDEQSYGAEHPEAATNLNNLAQLLQATNRPAEAEPLMRRALAIDEQSYGAKHPNVARDLNTLAALLQDTNRLAEAESLMRRAAAAVGGKRPDVDEPTQIELQRLADNGTDN